MEWPGREADHSLLSNAVIKNDWQRFPNYVPLNAVVQRDVNKFSVKKSSNKKKYISSSSSAAAGAICQTTGPKPLPKRFQHIVRSRASYFS